MTDTPTLLPVEQCDRDATASFQRAYNRPGAIADERLNQAFAAYRHRLAAQSSPGREERLAAELSDTADVLENLLSADPDMPTYQADYDAAENRLVAVRAYLHELAHPSEGGK